jgi:hypothetical protein
MLVDINRLHSLYANVVIKNYYLHMWIRIAALRSTYPLYLINSLKRRRFVRYIYPFMFNHNSTIY